MLEVRNRLDFEAYLDTLLALNATFADGYVANESLRLYSVFHKAKIADLLKDIKNNLLVQDGYGRGTEYYLPKEDSNMPSNESFSNIKSLRKRLSFEVMEIFICSTCSDWCSLDRVG